MKKKDANLMKMFIGAASVMILSGVLMGQPIAYASAATVNSETITSGISVSSPGKTYYLVASGDTVYSIAKHFKTAADNIKVWNELDENYSIYPGKIISIDGQNVYSTIDQETTTFTGDKQSFLNHILPIALDAAKTNGLYASVMLAQATHESNYGTSDLAKAGNNLFGIKGSYKGHSLIKKTWETNPDGTIVWGDAVFRLYPTIADSIRDYGVRLRYGPTVDSTNTSWDSDHYAGTWFENAATYLDAIQGLIDGGYATDWAYGDKLKGKITQHNLTQYDQEKPAELSPVQETIDAPLGGGTAETPPVAEPIILDSVDTLTPETEVEGIVSTKTTKYMAQITGGNLTLDKEPWGIAGYQTVANSSDYLGKTVEVVEEKVTTRATYAKFYLNGQFVWMEKVGLTPELMSNTKDVSYTAKVVAGGHSIDSLPWGVEGFTTVAGTSDYLNQLVTVTKETQTPRANWVLISQNGKELGWVDKNAVTVEGDALLSTKATSYMAQISGYNHSLDTLPWGMYGFQTIGGSSDYLGKTVEVVEEKVTTRATYAKFYLNGQFVWMEKVGLTPETMSNTKDVSYTAKVVAGGHSIDSLPWGVEGFTTVAGTSEYLNQLVTVTKETQTPRANWVLISQNGKEFGWVDKNAVAVEGDAQLSTKETSYMAQISGYNHSLDTLPWGMYGFQTIGGSNDHIGQIVEVVEERVTTRATWVKFYTNGQYVWMDKAGLTLDRMTNTRDITYEAKVISGGQTIDTLPNGIEGFQTVANTTDYRDQIVTVTKETHTFRGDWVLISQNGKELGWIGKIAVSTLGDGLLSTRTTKYMAQITGYGHSLDTLPWGMYGFQTIGSSNDHIGKTVEVVEERVTTRATWVKFYTNGQYVWMDKVGLTPEAMTNTKAVNYEATLVTGGHSIDSLPWGVDGFVTIAGTSDYLNQTVTVTKETQTPRANWALISFNGTVLGWIDMKALQPKNLVKPVIFIDPGHGGSDPGAQYSGVSEKNINLIVSNKVKANLEALGYQVIMSRYTDESVGLLQRSIEANASGADIFLSIHHNALSGSTANGIETYYYQYYSNYPPVINQAMHNDPIRIQKSAELAAAIHTEIVNDTGAYDRGIRRDTYAVLRETAIPAVLLELGYMTNPTELSKLNTNWYQTILAKAITDGIIKYFE